MKAVLVALLASLRAAFRSRAALQLEVLALRPVTPKVGSRSTSGGSGPGATCRLRVCRARRGHDAAPPFPRWSPPVRLPERDGIFGTDTYRGTSYCTTRSARLRTSGGMA